MAIPRPVLIAALGLGLIAAVFVGTSGMRSGDSEESSAPAVEQVADAGAPAAEAPAEAEAAAEQAAGAEDAAQGKGAAGEEAKEDGIPPTDGLPANVARALSREHVVVLVFFQDGSDDRATRSALASVRGRRGVTVVTDDIADVSKYRRVIANLGVNQAPAIVIVRPDRQAELLEGYVDAGTLAQEVSDAQ